MSYRVVFMTEAERDMDDIEKYLSQFYASTVRKFSLQYALSCQSCRGIFTFLSMRWEF